MIAVSVVAMVARSTIGLGYQHPIEWVFVMIRQAKGTHRVVAFDGNYGKLQVVDSFLDPLGRITSPARR